MRGQGTAQNAPQYTLMSPPINPWLDLTSLFPLFPLMKILMGFWGTAGGGAGASASPISEKAKRPYNYSLFFKTAAHRRLLGVMAMV